MFWLEASWFGVATKKWVMHQANAFRRDPLSSGYGRRPVWPDLAIYWTLGNFLKPLAIINLPKSPTVLGNFCVGAKIFNFSSEILFGQLLWTFGDFSLVTLLVVHTLSNPSMSKHFSWVEKMQAKSVRLGKLQKEPILVHVFKNWPLFKAEIKHKQQVQWPT